MKIKTLIITFILAAALLTGGALRVQNGAAQGEPPAGSPGGPSFAGASDPAQPSMTLLAADAQAIDLRADLADTLRPAGAQAETVSVEGQTFTRLSGQGYGYSTQPGMPELPVLRQEVEIPFGAQVTLELVEASYKDYSLAELGLYPIYPLQPPVVKLEESNSVPPFTIDQDFYANGGRYPATSLALGEEYIVRGHRIQVVEAWPVAYDPSSGTLRVYSQLTFRLRLSGSDLATTHSLARRYASPGFDTRLSQTVLNYNQGQPLQVNAQPGYLIITADAYYDAMQPFVNLKQNRGFDVTITKTSEIPNGGTTAGIKAYIQEAYDTWPNPPSYVLLVGDTNTVPTWTGPEIGTSTDLYYGTMDGASDWHPDIGRGRFPVRSPDQTTIMVNKYLAYATLTGQEPWLKTASFPTTCDNYTVGEGTQNYVINSYTEPNGFTGIFPNNPQPGGDKLYCVTYGATHQDLINAFNLGRWAIIYTGHGSYDGWEMNFTPTDVRNLTNYGMFPFVASHACLSGDFGQPEVFGETWVLQENKGALVYWGSSTYSYWDEDDVLERAMFDSLFAEKLGHADVATMTDDGLDAVEAAYPGSARYYRETYNVLGDPAVKIFMEPDMPSFTLNVEPDSQEVCTQGTVTSTVQIGSILNYSSTVYLEAGALPVNVLASFDPTQAEAPYSSTLTLDVASGAPVGDHTIFITATDQVSFTLDTDLALRIVDAVSSVPELLTPEDGAMNQPFQPTLTWETLPLVSSYNLQLGTSPLFEAPLIDVTGLPTASFTPAAPLEGGGCYWWRAQAQNACGPSEWAEPFHFGTVNLGIAFSDNLESGAGNWSHNAVPGGADHWVLTEDQSHSPTHAWFQPDLSSVSDARLWITDPIVVGEGSHLTFWQRYAFEDGYDGAVLEISTNGGGSWQDLGSKITANGYNGTISTCCSNPLGGRDAWTNDLPEWTQVEVDLSDYAGQSVLIRWRMGTDSSASDTGWYIDDVQMTSPLPANPAPVVSEMIPNYGSAFVPTPVQIIGSNFIETPSLRLDETWLLTVTFVNSTTLEAVVPAGIPGGSHDLTLYNGDCQEAFLAEAFTIAEHAPPVVVDDTATTDEDTPVVIDVLANDYDPEGADLSITAVGAPLHGTAAINGTQVVYTPTLDYNGDDAFTYTASDGDLEKSGNVSVTIEPVNDAPMLEASDLVITPEMIYESQAVTLTASFEDPDEGDAHTAAIDWGDGLSETLDLSAGILDFALDHTYADDPAEGDLYTVTVVISDGLAEASAETPATVLNVPPTLGELPDVTLQAGEAFTVTAVFTDPGTLDAHSVLIEWAEDMTQTLELEAGETGFDATFTYAEAGTYTVTLTLSDDDGGETTSTFIVTVEPVEPEMYWVRLPLVIRH